MTTPTARFISDLTAAADRCSDSDIAALLRRSALKIGNTDALPVDEDMEYCLDALCLQEGTSRNNVIRMLLRDQLTGMGLLPFHDIDEDGSVSGNA